MPWNNGVVALLTIFVFLFNLISVVFCDSSTFCINSLQFCDANNTCPNDWEFSTTNGPTFTVLKYCASQVVFFFLFFYFFFKKCKFCTLVDLTQGSRLQR